MIRFIKKWASIAALSGGMAAIIGIWVLIIALILGFWFVYWLVASWLVDTYTNTTGPTNAALKVVATIIIYSIIQIISKAAQKKENK